MKISQEKKKREKKEGKGKERERKMREGICRKQWEVQWWTDSLVAEKKGKRKCGEEGETDTMVDRGPSELHSRYQEGRARRFPRRGEERRGEERGGEERRGEREGRKEERGIVGAALASASVSSFYH